MHLLLDRVQKSILVLLIMTTSACESIAERPNNNFLKKYQKDVGRINSKRNDPTKMIQPGFDFKKNWKESIEIFNIENTETARTARIDTSKITLPDPPDEVLPTMKTFVNGRTRDLPDDMFDVSYNPYNFPNSYGRARLSFDDIAIPSRDAFGVETALGEKNYQLINHKTLQRDVDFVKKNRSLEDRQISAQLIREVKQAKRRKYLDQKNSQKLDGYVSKKESDDKIDLPKDEKKNTISKTVLKTQIVDKINKEMNQDVNKELSKEEADELMIKYQKDVEKMIGGLNKDMRQEAILNLSNEEKQELTEKEMAEMMLEINQIMSKTMTKNMIREASSR